MKKIKLTVFLLLSVFSAAFAQFEDGTGTAILNGEFVDLMRRLGSTGIGLYPGTTLPTSLLQVRANGANSQISHVEQGTFGAFASGSQWLGLGLAGTGTAYGLGIADNANVGVFNLLEEGARTNLIAGFGETGATNDNRFIVRGFAGSALTPTDLVIVNPNGAVGVNAEPQSSLWVDATLTNQANVPFRAIAIRGNQPLPSSGSTRTASAIGTQANNSLAGNGIAVEGLRAQIPDFAAVAQNLSGVATNLQTVKNPTATSALDVITPALSVTDEYAELTWQDLDFGDEALVDCEDFPIADAEELDKFFISFRNNESTDPFAAGNKLPVMTFQANGRVGIGTLQPTSGSCGLGKQTILLDVNGLIRASGSLVTSDRRFKQDIETIPNSLELIRKMRGATYTFNQEAFPDRNFSGGKQYGFIAQEVAEVIPELAVLNSDGYYAVNYTALIPVLAEAVKEQDAVMEEQKAVIATQADEIARLNAEMQQLRNLVLEMKSAQSPADLRGYRLEQNTPNPFGNTTQIRYALPEGTTGASINVYDLNGRLLRSYALTATEGAITINGADFPGGAYLYDLLVGGRQVDVKRLVLSKR